MSQPGTARRRSRGELVRLKAAVHTQFLPTHLLLDVNRPPPNVGAYL